jgi:hypothetical protein
MKYDIQFNQTGLNLNFGCFNIYIFYLWIKIIIKSDRWIILWCGWTVTDSLYIEMFIVI